MYSTVQCNEPNSSSPITQSQIDKENAYIAKVGAHFTNGNKALSDIIAVLTPPVPTGLCSDFTSSKSMRNVSPFPDYPVTGSTLPPSGGLGRFGRRGFRRRGMGQTGWDQMQPTGSYATPQPGFQFNISSLIPVWGCPGQVVQPNIFPGGGGGNATVPNPGPNAGPSVAGQPLPQTSSCWPWPCLLIVLAGIAMLLPSNDKKTEEHRKKHS